MPARTNRRPTKAELVAELVAELATRRAELARNDEAIRSLGILLERAEQDRDAAMMRLATCASENADFRAQLRALRAEHEATATGSR